MAALDLTGNGESANLTEEAILKAVNAIEDPLQKVFSSAVLI
jgi:hypothetical protein